SGSFRCRSSGAPGDEGAHDVGGVAIEVLAVTVVAGGRSRVGVAGEDLGVPEGHPGVEGGGHRSMSERMGVNVTGDARLPAQLLDHPAGNRFMLTSPAPRWPAVAV